MKNIILTPHTAMVDGRTTGLAGCSPVHQAQCMSASKCLRADDRLALHWQAVQPTKPMLVQSCSMLIPR